MGKLRPLEDRRQARGRGKRDDAMSMHGQQRQVEHADAADARCARFAHRALDVIGPADLGDPQREAHGRRSRSHAG